MTLQARAQRLVEQWRKQEVIAVDHADDEIRRNRAESGAHWSGRADQIRECRSDLAALLSSPEEAQEFVAALRFMADEMGTRIGTHVEGDIAIQVPLVGAWRDTLVYLTQLATPPVPEGHEERT